MPLGVRNNNPGNIRHSTSPWRGKVAGGGYKGFEVFTEERWGLRAMLIILRNYMTRYHLQTVPEIIHKYAPPSENATDRYVESVLRRTCFGREEQLKPTEEHLTRLAHAMIIVEIGREVPMSRIRAAYSLI